MCGHCCGPYFALYVEEADERRWEGEGRQDLLDRLEWERWRVRWDEHGPFNSETGERFERCIFLKKGPGGNALCEIHETKPAICRDYPPGSSELCVLFQNPD
jgi:Fe-S-cluster containining protein